MLCDPELVVSRVEIKCMQKLLLKLNADCDSSACNCNWLTIVLPLQHG